MTFAECLATLRRQSGLSQKMLCLYIGYSPQYYNDVEHGRRKAPTDQFIEAVARQLGENPTVLYVAAGRLPPHLRNRPHDQIVAIARTLDRRPFGP